MFFPTTAKRACGKQSPVWRGDCFGKNTLAMTKLQGVSHGKTQTLDHPPHRRVRPGRGGIQPGLQQRQKRSQKNRHPGWIVFRHPHHPVLLPAIARPDMSPQESDHPRPVSAQSSRLTTARMRHVRSARRYYAPHVCPRPGGRGRRNPAGTGRAHVASSKQGIRGHLSPRR